MFFSGNSIIDLIINDKRSVAADKSINLKMEIDQIGILPIADQDICVILANFLDNAIEACEHVENGEKWINIIIKRDRNVLLICIENSFQGRIIKKKW